MDSVTESPAPSPAALDLDAIERLSESVALDPTDPDVAREAAAFVAPLIVRVRELQAEVDKLTPKYPEWMQRLTNEALADPKQVDLDYAAIERCIVSHGEIDRPTVIALYDRVRTLELRLIKEARAAAWANDCVETVQAERDAMQGMYVRLRLSAKRLLDATYDDVIPLCMDYDVPWPQEATAACDALKTELRKPEDRKVTE